MIEKLEKALQFLLRAHYPYLHVLYKQILTDDVYNNLAEDPEIEVLLLLFLRNYLHYDVTLCHNYIRNEKYFSFLMFYTLSSKYFRIIVSYKDILKMLYNDISGNKLKKYLEKQLTKKESKKKYAR